MNPSRRDWLDRADDSHNILRYYWPRIPRKDPMDDAEVQLDRDATRMTQALELIIDNERAKISEPEHESEPVHELEIPTMDEDAL